MFRTTGVLLFLVLAFGLETFAQKSSPVAADFKEKTDWLAKSLKETGLSFE